MKASGGYASSKYSVSMIVGQHGLFDLILKAFEILNKEKLTDGECYFHLWSIVFDGTKFDYGWRGSPGTDDPINHIDDHYIKRDSSKAKRASLKVNLHHLILLSKRSMECLKKVSSTPTMLQSRHPVLQISQMIGSLELRLRHVCKPATIGKTTSIVTRIPASVIGVPTKSSLVSHLLGSRKRTK